MRSAFRRLLLVAALFFSFASAGFCQDVKKGLAPNIIFIMADDAGLGDFGSYGGKVVPTPNIDRLGNKGMRFTNAYSGSAVCAPTRSVLMTGKHTGHNNRRANASKNGLIPLSPTEITVASLLKGKGYATGGFGKWGLGNPGTTGVPEKHGFDLFYGYYDQTHAHNYFPAFLIRNSKEEALPGGNGVSGKAGKGSAYTPDLIVKETLGFIEKNKDQPFFVYAAWTLPHGLFEIPSDAPFTDRPWAQAVKNHAAMLARLDADVGRLMQKLKDLGLEENTIVMFTSDNGAEGPGAATFNSAAGLRGKKRSLHEGGVRAPFLACWPGKIKAGTTSDLLTSHVDFLATACDLAGAIAPKETDGISIVPTLLGHEQKQKHEALYWEIYEGPIPFQQGVRMAQWKGYRTSLKGPLELYDLSKDPTEATNIAAAQPEIVRQIEAIMAKEHVRNPNWEPVETPGAEQKKKKKKG